LQVLPWFQGCPRITPDFLPFPTWCRFLQSFLPLYNKQVALRIEEFSFIFSRPRVLGKLLTALSTASHRVFLRKSLRVLFNANGGMPLNDRPWSISPPFPLSFLQVKGERRKEPVIDGQFSSEFFFCVSSVSIVFNIYVDLCRRLRAPLPSSS